jgi:hypothetical protein
VSAFALAQPRPGQALNLRARPAMQAMQLQQMGLASALWDKEPKKNAGTALRDMPDVVATASMAQLQSSKGYVVFVCAVLGEKACRPSAGIPLSWWGRAVVGGHGRARQRIARDVRGVRLGLPRTQRHQAGRPRHRRLCSHARRRSSLPPQAASPGARPARNRH